MQPTTALPVRLRIADLAECDLGTITIDDDTTHPEMVERVAQLLEQVADRIRTWPSVRAENAERDPWTWPPTTEEQPHGR